MSRISVLAIAVALGACATQGASDRTAPGAATDLPYLAETVAAQLQAAAAGDPARLAALELEMRRISDALPAAYVQSAALTQPQPAEPEGAGMRPDPAPPTPEAVQAAAAAPAPADAYEPAPEMSGARSLFSALQLGAYPNADTARAAWFGMNAAHGESLAGLDARLEAVPRESGEAAYVLKAGPFASAQEAEALCGRLRQAGAVCTAGDFTGERL